MTEQCPDRDFLGVGADIVRRRSGENVGIKKLSNGVRIMRGCASDHMRVIVS